MKKILGISAFYHDAAAALLIDGKIIAAAQEERFTRKKHTAEFPKEAIRYCLTESGLDIDELDAIVFYDKPLLKFERLLQTYYAFAPKGLVSFLKAIPIWLKEKLFLKKQLYDGLKQVGPYKKKNIRLLFSEHHLSHAASSFFVSPYTKAAILTIDGVGEWGTATISSGDENTITKLKEMEFPHSVGLLYSAFAFYLGFKVNSGEYKLMGLAPYGNESDEVSNYIYLIKTHLISIKEDGSVWLNQKFFNYATGLRMVKDKKWEKIFGFPRRAPESPLQQEHCNLALAIQKVTEEIVLKMAMEAKRITGSSKLCMAGGVALNCVSNAKIIEQGIFENVYVQPAAGDAGGALGCALAVHYMYYGQRRFISDHSDSMQGTYLGPWCSDKEISQMNKKFKAVATKYIDFPTLTDIVAQNLAKNKIAGWFQGRMEFGPRALGNRSILANPRNIEMQQKLNLNIKYRESFRPFAPSVLEEDAFNYFNIKTPSPYMLLTAKVKKDLRQKLPENYESMSMKDKLGYQRSEFQAITHLDFSARVQTVHKSTNTRFWQLLKSVKEITGHGMVINTSFNLRGEPMVCTPTDAYRCFMSTDMDFLVINDYFYEKSEQPSWEDKDKWKMAFSLD